MAGTTDTTTTTTDTTADKTAPVIDKTTTIADQGTDKTTTTTGGDKTTTTDTTTTDKTTTDKTTTAPTWGDDWRARMAKGNPDVEKRLARYASPEAVSEALIAAQSKISSGELKPNSPYPEKGTDEEKTAWRKENGVPDNADGYFENLPKGVVLGETDKKLAADMLKDLHAVHASPAVAHAVLGWYTKFQASETAKQNDSDMQNWETVEDELRTEWGPEYTPNKNALLNVLAMFPGGKETGQLILNARAPDGRKLGANEAVLRGLVQLARTINPAGTITPGNGGDQLKTVETELAEIATKRKTDPGAYNADKGLQARERELIDAQLTLKKRQAA